MKPVIYVTIKNVYGKETVYPHCEIAQGFAKIAGSKTLTENTLVQITLMGYDIQMLQWNDDSIVSKIIRSHNSGDLA
jgi:hypothetical protein